MSFKILITPPMFGRASPESIQLLKGVGNIVRMPTRYPARSEELAQLVSDVDALIIGLDSCDKRVIESASKLKVIGRYGVGLDNIDLEAASKRGITVTYAPYSNTEAVAEYTIASILALSRSLLKSCELLRAGRFEEARSVGFELSGKMLGIIGLGKIGRAVALKARCLGMNVQAYDPYVDESVFTKLNVCKVNLDKLLRESDIITIHASLTNETKGLISKREIDLMKSGAIIINTSRSAIIDIGALIGALRDGKIAGAAIDALWEEIGEGMNELIKFSNVIVTPHIAGLTQEALAKMDRTVAEDVVAVLKGGRPRFSANMVGPIRSGT